MSLRDLQIFNRLLEGQLTAFSTVAFKQLTIPLEKLVDYSNFRLLKTIFKVVGALVQTLLL